MKPMAVSIWDPAGTKGKPVSGSIKPDDDHPPIPASWIEQGFVLVFALRDETVYTHGGLLTVTLANGRVVELRVILGPHIDVDIPQPVIPPVPRRAGQVRAEGKALRDDTGRFHPLGWTWFWALQTWKHNRDRCKRNGAYMARWCHYPRILCEVGTGGNPNSGWTGNTIEPARWPDYQEQLSGLMDWLWKDLGCRIELCVLGKGSDTDPLWLTGLIGDVVADGRQQQVVNGEGVNEHSSGHKISIPTMQQMAAIWKSKVPNVFALSNPAEGGIAWAEMEAATQGSGLSGFTVHHRRKFLDNGWAHVRQGYDNKNTRFCVLNNEPVGPGSSVEQMTNILQLTMTRAVSIMCGSPAFVFHTGTGVFGDGKPHASAGARPANFEEIPNIEATMDAVAGVDALIPEGVETWSVKNTQRAGVPFDLPESMHWGAGYENSSGFGVNKAYAAVSPSGEFIQMPIGVKTDAAHPCRPTATFAMKNATMFHPVAREPVVVDRPFDLGEPLDLPGRSDSMAAYIIRGQKA